VVRWLKEGLTNPPTIIKLVKLTVLFKCTTWNYRLNLWNCRRMRCRSVVLNWFFVNIMVFQEIPQTALNNCYVIWIVRHHHYGVKAEVPNLGYICLSEGVRLRLAIEEKCIIIYLLFPNICTYISENYFQKPL